MKKVALPDFDEMIELAESLGKLKTELVICKNELDFMLGEITQKVDTDESFYDDKGKPPSNAHVKDTYHRIGTNEYEQTKLKSLRTRIAELEGELKTKEALFNLYQDMIGVWRTQSANERGTFLE